MLGTLRSLHYRLALTPPDPLFGAAPPKQSCAAQNRRRKAGTGRTARLTAGSRARDPCPPPPGPPGLLHRSCSQRRDRPDSLGVATVPGLAIGVAWCPAQPGSRVSSRPRSVGKHCPTCSARMLVEKRVDVAGIPYTMHELVVPRAAGATDGSGPAVAAVARPAAAESKRAGGIESVALTLNDEHLLEQILRWLNPIELTRVRAVCRRWRAVADGSALWRPLCAKRWPSWEDPAMRAVIMARGGYAVAFRQQMPRPRSASADFYVTLDVVARTYRKGVAVDEVIGTRVMKLADSVVRTAFHTKQHTRGGPSADVLLVSQSPVWDLEVPTYKSGPGHPGAIPDIRIKCGVLHEPTGKWEHLATVHEGMGLAPKKYYRTHLQYDPRANDRGREARAPTNHVTAPVLGLPPDDRRLTFSGRVHLPECVGDGDHDTNLLEILLVGDRSVMGDKGVRHSIEAVRIGPLYNFARERSGVRSDYDHPASSVAELMQMFDLKLGLYREQQATSMGENTF